MELRRLAALDVSAASGLVELAGELCVVADDELFLAVYSAEGRPLRRVALFGGELPAQPEARKKAKPDLEALCVLPGGELLALGSGSRVTRARAARVAGGTVTVVDLAPLYDALRPELPDLNIEGAAVAGGALRLLARGNGADNANALIHVDLDALLAGAPALRGVTRVALPPLGGVPLGFTDAAPDGDRILFAAAAEDTTDPYLDGACAGSAIGLLDLTGRVLALEPAGADKIEGLARLPGGELRLCNDADDPALRAVLYAADWPRSWGP